MSDNNTPNNNNGTIALNPLYYRELLVEVAEVISRASEQLNVFAPHPRELHIKNELTENFGILLKITKISDVEHMSNMDAFRIIQRISDLRVKAKESILPKQRLLFSVGRDTHRPNGLSLKVHFQRRLTSNELATS